MDEWNRWDSGRIFGRDESHDSSDRSSDTSGGRTSRPGCQKPRKKLKQCEDTFERNVILLPEGTTRKLPNCMEIASLRKKKGHYAAKVKMNISMNEEKIRELITSSLSEVKNKR